MQDKLRIGVLLNEIYHPDGGGGYSYYQAIVKAIDDYEFNNRLEFVFITIGTSLQLPMKKEQLMFSLDNSIVKMKNEVESINKIRFQFRRIRLRKKYGLPSYIDISKLWAERSERWLNQNKIDLLYYLVPEETELNFPFVITHWDIGHYSMYAFPEVSMNNSFERRDRLYKTVYKRALAIFCESYAGKKELAKFKNINPERIHVVPLFPSELVNMEVNPEKGKQIIKEQFSLVERTYFLYPAQFWSHKNHYHLLLAMKKIVNQHPDLKLILPGSDKGNLEYVREVISYLGINSNVIIPGFISNETLYCLYKNAIALVMPTLLGPTNMPLLEAAYLGCPVITSDFEGHKEQLGDYATYINPLDEFDIYRAMLLEFEKTNSPKKEFVNRVNAIESAVKQIEENFLQIRKVRKTFGVNFEQF